MKNVAVSIFEVEKVIQQNPDEYRAVKGDFSGFISPETAACILSDPSRFDALKNVVSIRVAYQDEYGDPHDGTVWNWNFGYDAHNPEWFVNPPRYYVQRENGEEETVSQAEAQNLAARCETARKEGFRPYIHMTDFKPENNNAAFENDADDTEGFSLKMEMNAGEERVYCIVQNSFKDGCIFAFECVAREYERFAPELKDPDFISLIEKKSQQYTDNFIKAIRKYHDYQTSSEIAHEETLKENCFEQVTALNTISEDEKEQPVMISSSKM